MKNSTKIQATAFLKERALQLGFMSAGIARADYLEEEAPHLENWLQKGFQGEMLYMENYFDLRLDVRKLVPGAKSVVVLTYNYFPDEQISEENNYKISKYAYGRDYHKVIRKKLKQLMQEFTQAFGDVGGRCFVDSAPVLERAWAKKAGLGWIGKNSLLLSKQKGSFFFLCEMILDIELDYDSPLSDHCGTCTACMDACPTEAILPETVIDSSKCISYLTIELKNEIPSEFEGKMENWMYGCDICQDVCPWNRFSRSHSEPQFQPSEALKAMRKPEWEEITEEVFHTIFQGSAVKRTKFKGLQRNISFLKRSK